MLDTDLRTMIDEVKDGRMDRRGFVQRMLAFGLTAPMATQFWRSAASPWPRARRSTSRPSAAAEVR